jgi:hypothetical protein
MDHKRLGNALLRLEMGNLDFWRPLDLEEKTGLRTFTEPIHWLSPPSGFPGISVSLVQLYRGFAINISLGRWISGSADDYFAFMLWGKNQQKAGIGTKNTKGVVAVVSTVYAINSRTGHREGGLPA